MTASRKPAAKVPTALVHEPQARTYVVGKRRLNLSVSAELIERAREQGLNLSSLLEESLSERLRKAEGERWLAENAEAIAQYNARIERDGLWHKGLTPYY